MKRGLKSLLIFVVLGLIFGSLIGVVSAEFNYAASANGATAELDLTGHGANYITSNWYNPTVENGINGDITNYCGGGRYEDGRPVYMTYTITFAQPAPILNSIILDYICTMRPGGSYDTGLRLWDGSSWITVTDPVFGQTYYSGKGQDMVGNNEQISISAGSPWHNILKIEIYLYATTGRATSQVAVFDVQAIGPEPYSGPCLNEDDIILRLYQQNNSHAGLWNESNYDKAICFEENFGSEYSGNPRDCAGEGGNNFLYLYQKNNSHVAKDDSTGYNYPVCYGSLNCQVINNPDNCQGTIIASLYQEYNSHISKNIDYYPYKLCCGDVIIPNIYWAKMDGNPITEAQIGDTVLMIYKDKAGESHDFDIFEDDGIDNDDIRSVTETFDFGDHLAAIWEITQADFDLGHPTSDLGLELLDGEEEFKFTVNGITTTEPLIVQKDSYNNSAPSTTITNPLGETNYTISGGSTGSIGFEQISFDEDDDLRLIWNFGDGEDETFENIIVTGLGNTSHQYDSWGVKIINLRAEEMTRPQWDDDAVRIYVYDEGINVFAIIDKPNPNEIQYIQGRVVKIDASRSHAVNCSITCPQTPCYTVQDKLSINSLECHDLEQEGLKMEWTFYHGTEIESTKSGIYHKPEDTDKVVEFTHVFDSPGEHKLNLRVGYDTG